MSLSLCIRSILVALCLLAVPGVAQQRPTPQQARELISTRPDLVAQLRDRIIQSGMSAEDVRARLRSEGYPENLLDAYLPGARGEPDSVSNDVLSAIRALNITDAADTGRPGARDTQTRPDTGVTAGGARGVAPSPLFGLDVFKGSRSQFDPTLAGPVDANYKVGPGDRLLLILSGQVEAAYSLDVTREGFIFVPQVGRIDIASLTLGQIEDLLYDRLGKVYSELRRGADARTRFSVSPVRVRTNQIFVVGDVTRPGSYPVSATGTVLTALYAAGGPTNLGTLRDISVRRAGKVVAALDVYQYLLRGDASKDVRLENGDVVFVGVHGVRVEVRGEVLRPATYEVRANETLADLIANAGGLTPTASRQRIQIQRMRPAATATDVGQERFVLDIASPQLVQGIVPPAQLEAGDIVHIFPITDRVRRSIEVLGNVWTPSRVAFTEGLTLGAALRLAGGTKPDAYLGQVVINRLGSDSARVRVYASLRDSTGLPVQDVPLFEDDEVRVFSVTEFRQERFVYVGGAVRQGGAIPFREGMTLRDALLQAGGLHERALLSEVEVARMPDDRAGGRIATSVKVQLDSSYLFERTPDGKYLGPPGVPGPLQRAPEFLLRAYDNVLVQTQPNWSLPRHVTLLGEVRLPGNYTLLSKGERLSDLIARAGGLTEAAYPEGVSFMRPSDNIGRIGIDLPRTLRDPRHRDNLRLEDGDSIVVPQYRPTVVVQGAVNSPVAVSYVPGKNLNWYIEAAGGRSPTAQSGRAWVQQPNGRIQSRSRQFIFFHSNPTPQPGSLVRVPFQDPNEKPDRAAIVGAIAQVLGSLVTIAAIATRF